MKELYTSPVIEINRFLTEDIITDSSTGGETLEAELPEAEIPPVLDAEDIFDYN